MRYHASEDHARTRRQSCHNKCQSSPKARSDEGRHHTLDEDWPGRKEGLPGGRRRRLWGRKEAAMSVGHEEEAAVLSCHDLNRLEKNIVSH